MDSGITLYASETASPDAELDSSGYRIPASIPDVAATLEALEANSAAKLTEQIGQGLRTALGIGALSLLPDLIADLRKARDPDIRLKFIQTALKDGGYGTKDNKNDNLPTFNFTFNGIGASATVSVAPARDNSSAVDALDMAEYMGGDKPAASQYELEAELINSEVAGPETVSTRSVFDSIAL